MAERWQKAFHKINAGKLSDRRHSVFGTQRPRRISPEASLIRDENRAVLRKNVSKVAEDLEMPKSDIEAAQDLTPNSFRLTPSPTKSDIDFKTVPTHRPNFKSASANSERIVLHKFTRGRKVTDTYMFEGKAELMDDEELYQLIQSGFAFLHPVKELIRLNRMKLLTRIIKDRLVNVQKHEFMDFLQEKLINLAILSLKPTVESGFFGSKILKDSDVLHHLAELLHCRDTILDGLHILSQIRGYEAHQMAAKTLLYKLKLILIEDRIRNEVILTHWNPILVCVLLSELCDKLTNYSVSSKNHLRALTEKFKCLAEAFQSEMTEMEQIKAIYTDKSFHGLTLFDIVGSKAYKYRQLLHSSLVLQLIDDLWNGELNLSFGIHHASFVYRSLLDIKHPDDLWTMHNRKLKCSITSVFQYSSWKACCSVRYFFEILYLVVIIVVIFDTTVKYVRLGRKADRPLSLSNQDISDIKDMDDYIGLMNDWVFTPYFLLLTLHFFQVTVFRLYSSNKFLFDLRAPVNISLCLLISYIRLSNDGQFKNENIEYAWGLLGLCLILRFIIGLSITRTFGKILSMIIVIFWDIFPYLCLNFFVMIAFGFLAHLTFYRAESYSTFSMSMLTLFNASVGSFDTDSFADSQEASGLFFMSCWVVISNVMLLNLLIAVLSSRYEVLNPQAEADYVSLLYTFYKGMHYHPKYGALISFPAPFNILQIPFSLLYLASFDPSTINEMLFSISYIPMLVIASVTHIGLSILLTPISYIFNFRRILLSKKQTTTEKFNRTVMWMFGGVPYLLFLSIFSMRSLLPYLYQKPVVEESSNVIASLIKHLQYIIDLKGSEHPLKLSECSEFLTALPSRSKELIEKLQQGELNRFEELLFSVMAARGVSAEEQFASRIRIINKFADYKTEKIDLDFAVHMLRTWSQDRIESMNFYLAQKAYNKFAAI